MAILFLKNNFAFSETFVTTENYSGSMNGYLDDTVLDKHNSTYYLIWEKDFKFYLSSAADTEYWWNTQEIVTTENGSSIEMLKISDNGDIHIVYLGEIKNNGYRDLIHITDSTGAYTEYVLESEGSMKHYSPADMITTPDDRLFLYYNKDGWYRYNAPLYERVYNNGSWSERVTVSNNSFYGDDPDDFENYLVDINFSDTITLYISSGFYNKVWHGVDFYENIVYKYEKSGLELDNFEITTLSYNSTFFNYEGTILSRISDDMKRMYLNDQLIYEFIDDDKIFFHGVYYDDQTNIIVANVQGNVNDLGSEPLVYIFYLNNGGTPEVYNNAFGFIENGCIVLRKVREDFSNYTEKGFVRVNNNTNYYTKFATGSTPQLFLNTPVDETITSNTITFDWADTPTIDHYEIIVDNDPDFNSPEIHEPGIHAAQLTESQYQVTNWLEDNTYYWKVIAHLEQSNRSIQIF